MRTNITHVAMDTHKKEHAVAVVYADTGELVVFTVRNTAKDIGKMVKKIQRKAPGDVQFCYEAGVCGFTLKRHIEALGSRCMVIAPSLVPTKRGDRIKTDRRDAKKLLGQFLAEASAAGSAAMGAGHCRPGHGASPQAVLAFTGSGQALERRRRGAGAGVGRVSLVGFSGV